MNLGYAQGFIQAIKLHKKDDQESIMSRFKELSKDSDAEKYIIRLWEDR